MKKNVCRDCTREGGFVWGGGSEEAWERGRVFCRFSLSNWLHYVHSGKRPPACCPRKEEHLGKRELVNA